MELQRAVALLASACMLVRFWRKGLRHELSLAIAGALLRHGFSTNQVTNLIKAICYVSADEETDDRIQTIKSTADRLLKNESVFGLPKLVELTDRRLVDQLCKWLKIETAAGSLSNVVTSVKPDSNNSFKLTPLDQLVGEPEEDHSYVWQDTLITGGLSICSAKPKVGKSTLVRHKGSWSFEQPKTSKSRRIISLPEPLMKKLWIHKRKQNEMRLQNGLAWENHDLVFCSGIGTPHSVPNITYRYFRPLLKKAGLIQMRLYDLRHSHATLLLIAEENPKVVAERLGHSTIVLTMDTYSHVIPSMQKNATDKLTRLLYEQPEKGHKLKFGTQ